MKVVLLDTSYPICSRNIKIVQSIAKEFPKAEIHQVGWNRVGRRINDDNPLLHIYPKLSSLGKPWAKARDLWGYRNFACSIIKEVNPDVVIASHWDTLILVPHLDRKRQKLVYENLDIPTGRFRILIRFLEKMALRHTDLIIHASRFFKDLYPQTIKQFVLENKPSFPIEKTNDNSITHQPLRIVYIGSIRYKEILFNLIDAVRNDTRFHLTLHGRGPELEDVRTYATGIENVEMTGNFDYKDLVSKYTDADVVWAVYPNKDFNVKYAISNKFHESIHLRIPGVFAKETMLGQYVQQKNIGLVVDPYNSYEIKSLFSKIANGDIDLQEIRENLEQIALKQTSWEDDFKPILNFIRNETRN